MCDSKQITDDPTNYSEFTGLNIDLLFHESLLNIIFTLVLPILMISLGFNIWDVYNDNVSSPFLRM